MIDWNRLLTDHGPLVWQTAYRLTGNRADAEDVFQDTFLAALKVPLPVRSWPALLRHLATVQGLNRLRQRARRPQPLGDQDPPASAGQEPETQAHANELADRLRAILPRLAPQAAEVLCLHGLEGWSIAEIAVRLGLSTNAVGVVLHRARARARDLLGLEPVDPLLARGEP